MKTDSNNMKKNTNTTDTKRKFTKNVKGETIPASATAKLKETKGKIKDKNKPATTSLKDSKGEIKGKTTSPSANNKAGNNMDKNPKQKTLFTAQENQTAKAATTPVTDHKYLGMNYHEYKKDELYQKAQEFDIDGRTKMSKDELIQALYDSHSVEEVHEKASKANISGRSKMSKQQLINALIKEADYTREDTNTGSTANQSTGVENRTDYHNFSKEELYNKAQQKDVEGRSQMNKEELIRALYTMHTVDEVYNQATNANIDGRSKMNKGLLINELVKAAEYTRDTNTGDRTSTNTNTGTPHGTNYHNYSREELYKKAQQEDIDGRSDMNKDELIEALFGNRTKEEVYQKAKNEDIKGRSKMSKKKLIRELKK